MNPFSIRTRHELESHVAMILLQMPFPPLPLVVLNGEGEETIASSHDLLSQAISVSLISPLPRPTIQNEIVQKKQRILTELNTRLSNMWKLEVAKFMHETMCMKPPESTPDPSNNHNMYDYLWKRTWRSIPIQNCYEIYCAAFREYISLYPGSADLRIYPLSSVTMDTLVYQHAIDHLKAREAYIRDDIGDVFDDEELRAEEAHQGFSTSNSPKIPQVPPAKKDIHSYPDLIRLYAMSMYFESQVVD
tara:strand:+ start:527 stop:1267 length:741 start_codon:yes stop_codon:yes gene_type:complete